MLYLKQKTSRRPLSLQRYITLWTSVLFGIDRHLSPTATLTLLFSFNITARASPELRVSRRAVAISPGGEESILSALGNITVTMYVWAVCAQNKHRYLTRTHTCHIKAGEKREREPRRNQRNSCMCTKRDAPRHRHGDLWIAWKTKDKAESYVIQLAAILDRTK